MSSPNPAYTIVPLTAENCHHLPLPQEPIDVIGRLTPIYDGERWIPREELTDAPSLVTYPTEQFDPMDYVDRPNQAGFLAMQGNVCVGTIRVCERWQKNAFIDDLAVNRAHRGKGVGTRLMDAAVAWGREHGCWGMSLETQSWNLLAIRFYLKYGYRIGGMDTCVYRAMPEPYTRATALYLYMLPGDQP